MLVRRGGGNSAVGGTAALAGVGLSDRDAHYWCVHSQHPPTLVAVLLSAPGRATCLALGNRCVGSSKECITLFHAGQGTSINVGLVEGDSWVFCGRAGPG